MNFNNKLQQALCTLKEEPLSGATEAAIDEYIDRYNGDKAAIYNHLLDDLYDHYYQQINTLHARAIQCESSPRERNTTGRPSARHISHYINQTIRLLLRPEYPPVIGRDAEFANRHGMLQGIARELKQRRYGRVVDQKTIDKFRTILQELIDYMSTIHQNVQAHGRTT